jgi:hypothetical protein
MQEVYGEDSTRVGVGDSLLYNPLCPSVRKLAQLAPQGLLLLQNIPQYRV